MRKITGLMTLLILSFFVSAQESSPKKYNSLLWEISGNGLKKPSYLFGTMHVSSKLAFHLSDSFYYAIKRCDKVAIELNPEEWQPEMARQIWLAKEWNAYNRSYSNTYINEYSFRIDKYEEKLKRALSAEPASINMLLYRSYELQQDFEEDTFLDMYIYQTGRKLGKQAAGVEDFWEMARLVAEAYDDMRKDKKVKNFGYDNDAYDATLKMQEAYKKGDLDQLDSLNKKMQTSELFLEKFLYQRNINQANAIDSIIQRNTLFVGVGSAHLPGNRGVIELLRKKGYKLRPIFMKNRDAEQKDTIEKMKVPVVFKTYVAEDGFFKVQVPGQLYHYPNPNTPDLLQYADMANGVYYTIHRLQTHAAIVGQSADDVLKKVDSLLYENIPGKILVKKAVTRNGYHGYEIWNKTRRGDMQRHQIIVTPFEILIFKMSGTGDYVGTNKEAEQFFNSIEMREVSNQLPRTFQPSFGSFSVQFPHAPSEVYDESSPDDINTWYYEAYDEKKKDAYMLMKKSVHQFDFMEEDSFDISLADESFRLGDHFQRNLSTRYFSLKGYPCLDVIHRLKDSSNIYLRYIFKGPHYYMMACHTADSKSAIDYFNSFSFQPYRYGVSINFKDTFYKFSVTTPVYRNFSDTLRKIMNMSSYSDYGNFNNDEYRPVKYYAATFSNASGQMAGVGIQCYSEYYRAKDSLRFWKEETGESYRSQKFIMRKKEAFSRGDSVRGYQFWYSDTGSSKLIRRIAFLYKNRIYRASFITDTLEAEDGFMKEFFSSLSPLGYTSNDVVFSSKSTVFFSDLYSTDSVKRKRALSAVLMMDFDKTDIPMLMNAARSFKVGDKDYISNKSSFVKAIVYIEDSTADADKLKALQELYKEAGDTSVLQNELIAAIAKLRTKEAFTLVKQLLLQDPPVFDNDYDMSDIFQSFSDTLQLAKHLFPELLQLSSIDDYKGPVLSILSELVDSGYVASKDYESYLSKLMFDTKFLLKKLKSADEKILGKELKQQEADEPGYDRVDFAVDVSTRRDIYDHTVLLMPFYDKNEAVRNVFVKLLQTKDDNVKLQTVLVMLRNHKTVPDSILLKLASKDEYRVSLYRQLDNIKKLKLFPQQYCTQMQMARGVLYDQYSNDLDSLEYITRKQVYFFTDTGWVYVFKYKNRNQSEWRIALSGLQPLKQDAVCYKNDYVSLTDVKINGGEEPLEKKIDNQLKKEMFSRRASSKTFFSGGDNYSGYLNSFKK
jgi:uncharacterized protein YbaP (TraB family)